MQTVLDWLDGLPLSHNLQQSLYPISPPPSPSQSQISKKRKTMASTSNTRARSPQKRQRLGSRMDDNITPQQSASVMTLSDRTELSCSTQGVAKRAASPTRDLLRDLRAATPIRIYCQAPSNTSNMPAHVWELYKTLTKDLEIDLIPAKFKESIDKHYPCISETLPTTSFQASGSASSTDLDQITWDSIEEILSESLQCGELQQDENAWCTSVVHPLLRMAVGRQGMTQVQNVQSQNIQPNLLPTTQNNYRVRKKADYCFSYRLQHERTNRLYQSLEQDGLNNNLGHTTDANTRRSILFSGVEVKPESGSKDEALAQLAIWLYASQENLLKHANPAAESTVEGSLLPAMVGWTVIGHDWLMYLAYRDKNKDGTESMYLIGPWRAATADTRDVLGILKIMRLLRRTMDYACTTYWDTISREFFAPLLPSS